jgi:hypothetical protein
MFLAFTQQIFRPLTIQINLEDLSIATTHITSTQPPTNRQTPSMWQQKKFRKKKK